MGKSAIQNLVRSIPLRLLVNQITELYVLFYKLHSVLEKLLGAAPCAGLTACNLRAVDAVSAPIAAAVCVVKE